MLLDLRIEVHMDAGFEEIAFDYFRIHSDVAVPVELLSFDAQKEKDQVKLQWATATELDNDFFVLEHSTDGTRFNEIEQVAGAGDSGEVLNYEFMHTHPSPGLNYYRLQQVDYDRTATNSKVVSVSFGDDQSAISVTPNPFTNMMTLNLTEAFQQDTDIVIYNLMGQQVFSGIMGKGESNKDIDLSALNSGVYILEVGQGMNAVTKRIVKF